MAQDLKAGYHLKKIATSNLKDITALEYSFLEVLKIPLKY